MSAPGLRLERVVKHYRAAGEVVRAVDGVDLDLAPGEMVALYGPSGSGKTTLLLMAAGLVAPDAGTVTFDGRDIGAMNATANADYQRTTVGLVSQAYALMAGVPAVDNAAVKLLAGGVPLREARDAAAPWLKRVGLAERLRHTPAQLSGGERQRVAIARALVGEPRLILADEPTGSLDTRRGSEILRLLAEIGSERNASVLLVTHDPRAAAVADRVLTIADGRVSRPDRERLVAQLSAE